MKTLFLLLSLSLSTFAVGVVAPAMSGHTNSKVTTAFTVTDADEIIAFQFNVHYDPLVLTPTDCSTGSLAFPMLTVCNVDPDGTLRVAVYGSTSFSGDGTILNVKFYTHKGSSDLAFSDVYFFDQNGWVESSAEDGEIILE